MVFEKFCITTRTKNPRHTFVCRGFFLRDREDSNSNDDDRSQRLKQEGVVGAAF